MKIGKLKVYSKEVEIVECESEESYECLVKIVGGYLESLPFNAMIGIECQELNNVVVMLDEEGKLKQKPINIKVLYDYIVGDIAFVGTKGAEIIGLTDKQIELIQEVVNKLK